MTLAKILAASVFFLISLSFLKMSKNECNFLLWQVFYYKLTVTSAIHSAALTYALIVISYIIQNLWLI